MSSPAKEVKGGSSFVCLSLTPQKQGPVQALHIVL